MLAYSGVEFAKMSLDKRQLMVFASAQPEAP